MKQTFTQQTIGLIDDDRIYQFTARRIIELVSPSQKVLVFSNGKEAIDFFINDRQSPNELPDLIFLDINMPVMNGWEFLEAYRQLNGNLGKSITIYMVSSSMDEKDMARSKSFEAVKDFIVKPLDKQRMFEILVSSATTAKA